VNSACFTQRSFLFFSSLSRTESRQAQSGVPCFVASVFFLLEKSSCRCSGFGSHYHRTGGRFGHCLYSFIFLQFDADLVSTASTQSFPTHVSLGPKSPFSWPAPRLFCPAHFLDPVLRVSVFSSARGRTSLRDSLHSGLVQACSCAESFNRQR
jgi:hypothetical protein